MYFAYSRQAHNDPENIPYYFDCLQQLAQGRQSEFLTIKTSEISAQGVVGRKDLVEAYKDLGITDNLQTAKSQPDSYIINLYRALVTDCGPERRARARNSLQKVGQSRGSKAIMNAASDTVETYEEALAYLGADGDMNDEAITALYGTKVSVSRLVHNDTFAFAFARFLAQLHSTKQLQTLPRLFISIGFHLFD